MKNEMKRELMKQAIEARKLSYSPYSHFQVGAALLGKSGTIYKGCNVENAAYSPCNCAERTAFFKAVSEGEREFVGIAIVGGPEDGELGITAPCGVCRQVMMEFCEYDTFEIILGTEEEAYSTYLLKDMMPLGFGPDNLK